MFLDRVRWVRRPATQIRRREQCYDSSNTARLLQHLIRRFRIAIIARRPQHQTQVTSRTAAERAKSVRVESVVLCMQVDEAYTPANIGDCIRNSISRGTAVPHDE